jgi:hypothetical protein
MSAFLRKYGTGSGADIYIPIIKRAVVDFAVSADWTPAAGDVKISKDGGAAANIGTLPTALTMGNGAVWKFVFTDAELQAKYIIVTVVDSATKAVEDQSFVIETYGNASALHPFDLSVATQSVNVTQISGDSAAADNLEKEYDGTGYGQVLQSATIATLASQTSFTLTAGSADNDAYNGCVIVIEDASTAAQKAVGVVSDYTGATKTVALLNDPAVFTMAVGDVVTILADRSLKPSIDNRSLDVTATGAGGVDWGNVENPSTSNNLSGTTVGAVSSLAANSITASVIATDAIDADAIADGAIDAGAIAADAITAAKIADGAIDAATFAAGAINAAAIATGAIDADALAADAANEIRDAVWAQTMTEPSSVIGWTGTLKAAIEWLVSLARNKITQSSTTQTLRNDADSATIATSTVSDDGTTFTRGEWT